MSNIYNEMQAEQIFDEIAHLSANELIDEILETTVWRSVDPDTIPECQLSIEELQDKVIDKRFYGFEG